MHQSTLHNIYSYKTELKFTQTSGHVILQELCSYFTSCISSSGETILQSHYRPHWSLFWLSTLMMSHTKGMRFSGEMKYVLSSWPKNGLTEQEEKSGSLGFMVAKGWNFCILAGASMIWNPHWCQRKEHLHYVIGLPMCGAERGKGCET